MPDILFKYEKCGQQMGLDGADAGVQVNCPSCGANHNEEDINIGC